MKFLRNVLAVLAVAFFATQAMASDSAVKDYTQWLIDDVLGVIASDASEASKLAKLDAVFQKNVDTNWIGKFVLGKYWRTASAQQQQDYLNHYAGFLSKTYTKRFTQYSNEKVNVGKVSTLSSGEYSVELELEQPGGEPVYMTFKVRGSAEANMKIFDINVEGVSLITTQRSEFGAVVERKGLDYLIGVLKKRANS